MVMWLEHVFVLSFFALIQLLVLATTLNARVDAIDLTLTEWHAVFAALYVLLGVVALYVLFRMLRACGICNGSIGRRVEDDDYNTRTTTTTYGGDDDDDDSYHDRSGARLEGCVVFGDAVIDTVFLVLDGAIIFLLASELTLRDANSSEANWTTLFVLIFVRLGLLLTLIIFANLQTYALENTLARGSRSAAVCGGLLCCSPTDYRGVHREMDVRSEQNTDSGIARAERYETRAEFQDWPCVYLCTPHALGNFILYLRAVLLFFIVPALIATVALLLTRLDSLDAQAPLAALHMPTTTTTTSVGVLATAAVRQFAGRHHHIATHALPYFLAAGNFSGGVASHPSLRWDDAVLPLGIVLLPLFTLLALLLLAAPCMGLVYCCDKVVRGTAEWLLGAGYVITLIASIVVLALVAERVDSDNTSANWDVTFLALYIALAFAFLAAAFLLPCCTPSTYKLRGYQRSTVSKWGLFVYRRPD